jgi:chemotaxis protein CheD
MEAERRRYYDPKLTAWIEQVSQGQVAVTDESNIVYSTVLGSCIAACVRDPLAKVGGMNHFLLPVSTNDVPKSDATSMELRYGNYSMEVLVNEVLKRGGRRERIEVKLFGGGNVMQRMASMNIGHRNADFIEKYVQLEGLKLISSDVRGVQARRVQYFPITGRARMMAIVATENEDIFKNEMKNRPRAEKVPSGDIELFD